MSTQNMSRPMFTQRHYDFLAEQIAREVKHYVSLGSSNCEFLREQYIDNEASKPERIDPAVENLERNMEAIRVLSTMATLLCMNFYGDNNRFSSRKFWDACGLGAANVWLNEARKVRAMINELRVK